MKPKDLLLSFEGKKRVLLAQEERVLYVPTRTSREGISFSLEELFDMSAPIHIEICSGNGDWICQKAIENPNKNWIALEMRLDRVRKIWSKMKNRGLANLFIVCSEAIDFMTHFLKPDSVDEISVNFPDPWPKRRHAKNRLIQKPFFDELSRVLKPEALFHVLTDDFPYFDQIRSEGLSHQSFISLIPDPYYTEPDELYGTSYFMKLWKEQNRSFYFSKFQKRVHS
jgi:tRNA (guanine-N7-)-methyltransferase